MIAPAAANAGWLPPVDLSKESEFGFNQEPQIAVDASGGAVAVWPQLQGHYLIQASTKAPGGTWEPPVEISPSGKESREPQVAMNDSGQAIAVWAQRTERATIMAASRTAQGGWGPAEELAAPGGDSGDLDVAIDPDGYAVAIWTKLQNFPSDYLIEAATRSPAGQWGSAVPLSELGQNAWGPKLAITPSGRAIATWYRWNGEGDTIVQVAEKEPGSAWSEPENLSAPGAKAFAPDVGIGAGRAVVIWQRDEVVEASVKEGNGAWQPSGKISGPESQEPAIGIDAQGNALAIWSSGPEYGWRNAEVASLQPGETWTESTILSERLPAEGAQPHVAVDPQGQAVAIWTAGGTSGPVVEAASGTTEGDWESPDTISSSTAWARNAHVAMDSAGNAAAIWRAATPRTMQAAIFDETNPKLSAVSIPLAGRAGHPISFAASPFDAWSPINSTDWTFGDGSTATGSSVVHSFQEAGHFPVTVTTTDAAGHSSTASAQVVVAPALATPRRVAKVRHGKAHLKLRCLGTAPCHGNAELSWQTSGQRGPRHWRSIGGTTFAIPAETEITVSIKLKLRTLIRLVASHKKGLSIRLTGDAVEPRAVTLKSDPGPRPHKSSRQDS
jgi:hypothetical protein